MYTMCKYLQQTDIDTFEAIKHIESISSSYIRVSFFVISRCFHANEFLRCVRI